MMKHQEGYAVLVVVGIWILAVIGWGLNIWQLYGAIVGESWASAVIRGIGVFVAPLGAVIGYLPF